MIIEGNPKELAAMEQFHNGNRQAGLALQEEFAAAFREEYKEKTIVLAGKLAAIMATARNASPFTAPIRNMYRIACGR